MTLKLIQDLSSMPVVFITFGCISNFRESVKTVIGPQNLRF